MTVEDQKYNSRKQKYVSVTYLNIYGHTRTQKEINFVMTQTNTAFWRNRWRKLSVGNTLCLELYRFQEWLTNPLIRVCSIILRYRKDFYFILEAELGRIPASERAKRKKGGDSHMDTRGCSSQKSTDVPMWRIKAIVEELDSLIWTHRQMIYTCLRWRDAVWESIAYEARSRWPLHLWLTHCSKDMDKTVKQFRERESRWQ